MMFYSTIFLNGQVFKGNVEVENNRAINIEERISEKEPEYVFVPYFTNMHTHLGDSFVEDEPYGNVEEIVGPGGFKEKHLAAVTPQRFNSGIRRNVQIMVREWTLRCVDFREGGIEGVHILLPNVPKNFECLILSRPKKPEYDESEIDKLLEISAGIALSSITDYPLDLIFKIREKVRSKNKMFAIHVSERIRENIDTVIDLKPNFVVHMLEATDRDLEILAQESIPVVISARANSQFGKYPNLSRFLKHGVKIALGTDNGMICAPSIRSEMEYLYRISNIFGHANPVEILRMSTVNPLNILKIEENWRGLLFRSTPYKIVTDPHIEPFLVL